MACGCRKGRPAVEPSPGAVASSGSPAVRGVQRSRMAFVVDVDGVERTYWSLREARVAADLVGGSVTARRTVVE